MICPYCAEEIKDDALICRHCRSLLVFPPDLMKSIKEIETRIENIADRVNELAIRADYQQVGSGTSEQFLFLRSIGKMLLVNLILVLVISLTENNALTTVYLFFITALVGGWVGSAIQNHRAVRYFSYGALNVLIMIVWRLIIDVLTGNLQVRYGKAALAYNQQYFYAGMTLILVSLVLIFATGAFAGEFLHRLTHPKSRPGTFANRVAARLVPVTSGAPSQGWSSRAQGFVAFLLALLPPILTLVGSIVTAYFGYLAAIGKPAGHP